MTDYPVAIIPTFTGSGLAPTTGDWYEDGDPATVATFYPAASSGVTRWMFDLSADLTAVTGLVGWRVEVDIVSGTGGLFWDFAFDHPSGSGYVAFRDTLTVAGAGTYSTTAGTPYFVSSTSGHTYGGIYDVVTRLAYEVGYRHGYGQVDPVFDADGGPIVVSEFRVIFFTDSETVVRLWPRDDSLGRNATPRRYPPPRGTRRIGGQP